MSFISDKQTLDDLNVVGKYKNNSIFNLFNHTHTRGGERVLENLFQYPLSDAVEINKRSAIFDYFRENDISFPFEKELFDAVEHYTSSPTHGNQLIAMLNMCRRKFLHYIASDKEFEVISSGLLATIEFFNILRDFVTYQGARGRSSVYADTLEEMNGILQEKRLEEVLNERGAKCFSLWQMIRYDYLLRCTCLENIKRLMEIIYWMDVYVAGGRVARERGFTSAVAVPKNEQESHIHITNVFHPQLSGAVPNSVFIDSGQNVIFLTGANMAGKSTFMKSFGVAVYLAHMGFPVAAEKMEFTVQDGMYTSINVPDNLNMGYSHFYAEVLRIKKVAIEVSQSKNLVIIFDELFKGTNVKDAYDATVAVTEAFAEKRNCSYIISTHITEAGHTLKERCPRMKFVFLPTVMDGCVPRYTYILQNGITNDRHGMMIIKNEHILDIING
ncbi:MAG: DNA mismatch repair protein [Odoribacter sp.]